MKLTKEMVLQAIKTSHDKCHETDCIHADAVSDASRQIMREITNSTKAAFMVALKETGDFDSAEVMFYVWCNALHVGYRLKELELEKEQIEELKKIHER